MPPVPGGDYQGLLAALAVLQARGVQLGLDRVREALARVGHPEARFVSVQIAGTNGKGSVAAMTDAVLRAAGWRVGLYTSPHLCRFTERIRVDGVEVAGDTLARLYPAVATSGVPLTYFESATLLALLAMADARVDIAVLETGLGGRLDAVTAVPVVATAITSVAMDHTDVLGEDLLGIAREKAAIARAGVPLFVGPLEPRVDAEVARMAASAGAPLFRFGDDFRAPETPLQLAGTHQRQNAALAVALARVVGVRLGRELPDASVSAGLRDVRWPGRLEWIAPDVLLDGAHNPEAAGALAGVVSRMGTRKGVLVVAMVRGKDVRGTLAPLVPHFDAVVITASRNPRSLSREDLATQVRSLGAWQVHTVPHVVAAIDHARGLAAASPGGFVCVTGSLFAVGEARAYIAGEPVDPTPTADPLP